MVKRIFAILLLSCFAFLFSIKAMAQKKSPVLNHIAHYVVDLKVSTDFYMHIVGLDSIPEPFHDGRHTWLSIGYKSHLHLISGAAGKKEQDKNAHLCFSVESVNDFIKVLNDHHIEYESWLGEKNTFTTRPDGVKQIYFKDPDGYWLEINDAKE